MFIGPGPDLIVNLIKVSSEWGPHLNIWMRMSFRSNETAFQMNRIQEPLSFLCWTPLVQLPSVWTDLAKIYHFGKISKVLGIFRAYS